ncbi:hypothetical protein [Microseira sp. BLCC-F43]|jgi:hypothetical protein|uniref:hypothetical protein n=1 Tax=Microseira sp. BLCC-F43 TaxID=3153602 RepID=UPI0035BB6819
MNIRALVLLITVVLPGLAATSLSAYYLFPEWKALEASFKSYEKLAKSPAATIEQLSIAQAAENRHRINCFAEGVGVLLGGVILAIGIHGICAQSSTKQQ